MIWILTTRGISRRQSGSADPETTVEGAHSVVYRPGVEPIPLRDDFGTLGTYVRGPLRASGVVYAYDGNAAETLLGLDNEQELIIRYQANGAARKRTISRVLFSGDATVTVPALNEGVPLLIGVPFRVQIELFESLSDRITDEPES